MLQFHIDGMRLLAVTGLGLADIVLVFVMAVTVIKTYYHVKYKLNDKQQQIYGIGLKTIGMIACFVTMALSLWYLKCHMQ